MKCLSKWPMFAAVCVCAAAQVITDPSGLKIRPKAIDLATEYRLQPGDEIEIRVLNLPELSATVRIRPDGMVSLVVLNEVKAAGRSVAEFRQMLADEYGKHYRTPKVGVVVKSFANREVFVTGQVARPGAIPLSSSLTAVQAIIQAGGLLPNSKTEEAVLIRQLSSGTPQVTHLKIDEVLNQGQADITLEPADVIYIPKSDIKVYVGGQVARPGLLPLDGPMTALGAVVSAGGFADDASTKDCLLLRKSGTNTPTITHLRLDQVLKGGEDTPLKPFDVVYVPRSGIGKADRFIDQYIRRLNPISLNAGFSYLIGGVFH